jgi:hypothetical protein
MNASTIAKILKKKIFKKKRISKTTHHTATKDILCLSMIPFFFLGLVSELPAFLLIYKTAHARLYIKELKQAAVSLTSCRLGFTFYM